MARSKKKFKGKQLAKTGSAVLAMGSLVAACATATGHRSPANRGDWGGPVPWGDQHAGGDWGGHPDPDMYRNPEGHVDRVFQDLCQEIVSQDGTNVSSRHHHRSHRSIANVLSANVRPSQLPHPPFHPQPHPQPGQPQPQPQQPAQQPPPPPAFDRAAALQQCEAGRLEAIRQARQATRWVGMTEGYMAAFDDGRRQGMASADLNKNSEGYQLWVNQSIQAAKDRGLSAGSQAGSSQAGSDVIGMFQNAVTASGGSVPASNPPSNFNTGFGGYTTGWTDSGHPAPDYSAIMQTWVDNNLGTLNLPDAYDDDYFRYGAPPLDAGHFRAYWTNDGFWAPGYRYHVENPVWDDDNDGWNHFSHGQTGNFFLKGYRSAYRQAAEFWFRVSFYQGANRGDPFDSGFQAGRYVQEQYAYQLGEQSGYDYAYRRDSITGYNNGYAKGYLSTYRTTYSDYAENPKINFNLAGLSSSLGDFVSGADVTASLHVVNYGGQGASLKVTSSGLAPANDGSTSSSFDVNGLQMLDQTTNSLGKIQPGFTNGQSDQIVVDVQQIYGSSSLDLGSQTVTEVLDSWAEIKGVGWQAPYNSFMQGTATFQIALQNPLTYTTPGSVDLVATIGGAEQGRVHVGQLAPQQSTSVTIQVKGVDPIQVFSDGVNIAFRLEMAGGTTPMVTSTASGSVAFTPDPSAGVKVELTSQSYWMAQYFEYLATSGASQDKIAAASNVIYSFAQQEIQIVNDNDFDMWGDSASANESVIDQLGYAYYNQKNKTPAYTAAYETLGEKLIGLSAGKGIQPHGLFGKWNNRDGFRNAVKTFAPNAQNPD